MKGILSLQRTTLVQCCGDKWCLNFSLFRTQAALTASLCTLVYSNLFSFFLCRHLSTSTRLPSLSKIHTKYKNFAVQEAQKALIDYLHGTRSLPYMHAECIAKNSHLSLYNLISKVDFSAPRFSKNFKKFFWYHPINEFEFFFESIGIDYNHVSGFLPKNKFFLSEDGSVLNAASALSEFGFPWNKLGLMYKERSCIFSRSAVELKSELSMFMKYGFNNIQVVSVCLAFPCILSEEGRASAENDGLFTDLKRVFVDFDLASSVEESVDSWYVVCRNIRVFYDLLGGKGNLGELLGRRKNIFLEYKEKDLIQKADYFCKFGVKKEEVALLLLQCPKLLNIDLEMPVISVLKLLKHFGLSSKQMNDVHENYAHVLGTNKMANLPYVMRALNLHLWFFNKLNDDHQLLVSYIASHPNEDENKEYQDGLERIRNSRTPIHTMSKLNFMHGLGFGENGLTIKILAHLHGSSSELRERFDHLLHLGIEFSKLCAMLRINPKVLNQSPGTVEQKVHFLCQEMGSSLEYLDTFPAYLNFDLEYRIKPRYRFYVWLKEKGVCTKDYSIASMIATSEKNFVARAFKVHPAAPKHWFEQFSCSKPLHD